MPELMRVARAVATNQVARLAPTVYLRLTGQTGRGDGAAESLEDIAAYFRQCVADYLAFAGVPADQAASYFAGKTIVEYGPGDFPGVAVLMLAAGAHKVYAVDRFAMVRLSEKNVGVWHALVAGMGKAEQQRARLILNDSACPAEGFRRDQIEYVVRPHGFSGLQTQADLALSRAVLEHVDDLPGTFADMLAALKPGGVAMHQVDLKSHGLHRNNPLDFLEWPSWLWSMMYSHKGVPNRWRLDAYRRILQSLPVQSLRLEPTHHASAADVAGMRGKLPAQFTDVSDTDLACLGTWVGFAKPGA